MKKQKVPQDQTSLDYIREICYAVDENGKYTKVQSSGWEAKDTALNLAWDVLNEHLQDTIRKVKEGELSPLAYFMEKNQLDAHMLSGYTGISSRKIKKHLHPGHFGKLDDRTIQRYAEFFRISPAEFVNPELP